MMKKLYLIRRNLESFAGPMTLSDMRHEYKRMAFGLQDEVSGHVGPWVSFDDIEKLRRYYPEVAKVVHDEMFAGWGVSEHTAQRLVTKEKKKPLAKGGGPRQRNLGLAVACIIIAIFAFAAAIYLATGNRYSGKLMDGGDFDVAEIDRLTEAEDFDGAISYLETNLPAIVPTLEEDGKSMTKWLPHLRLYAFAKEGIIDGVSAKQIRGAGAVVAPSDCSLPTWKKRWRQSAKQWQPFLEGKALTKAYWARTLAWDPHWIRGRETKGWIKPKNFFVGCLDMAYKAMEAVNEEAQADSSGKSAEIKTYGNQIQRRLLWLLEMSRDGRSIITPEDNTTPTMLSLWTCQEQARSPAEFEACPAVTPGTEPIRKYLEERGQTQQLRIAFLAGEPMPPQAQASLLNLAAIAPKSDSFTRFDYKAELRFAKALLKLNGSLLKASQKVNEEYPEFNPRY